MRLQLSRDIQYSLEEIPIMADNYLRKISTPETLTLIIVYSPLLSKTFNAYINIEFCGSVKNKYVQVCEERQRYGCFELKIPK